MSSLSDRDTGVHGAGPPQPARSLVAREFLRIGEAFDAGDRLFNQAQTPADREKAEELRREASAAFWSAGEQLGDLFLLMMRYAVAHRGNALALYLLDVLVPALLDRLRPELEGLVREVIRDDLPDCLAIYLHRRNGEEAP
jgi:hypothetical protein